MDRDGEEILHAHSTTCCIVGGGPGGAVLALLLARRRVPVMLLEAHKDFDREFRGARLIAVGARRVHVAEPGPR